MKRLMIVAALCAAAASLSACADTKLTNYVCTHQVALTVSANAAIANAALIKEPALRQAAIDGANTTLALIAHCDPATPQTPANTPAPVSP